MNTSNGTNNLTELCATAAYLSNSKWLLTLNILQIVLAVVGISLFIILFPIQGTQLAFHKNARLLLISHHLWSVFYCIATIAWHCFDLIRFAASHPKNSCEYLISQEVSALFRAPLSFTVYGNSLAVFTMVIERIFATLFYRNYEKKGIWLGWVLILAQYLLASVMILLLVLPLDWTEMRVQVSLVSNRTSSATYTSLVFMASFEVLTITIFHCLLTFNRRLKRRQQAAPLTEKYQIDENIRAARLMIPMMWTHISCFLPTLIAFPLYIKLRPDLDPRDYTIFTAVFNWVAIYGPLLPIVLLWRHKVLRENLWRTVGIRSHSVRPSNSTMRFDGRTEEQVVHFEALKQFWATAHKSDCGDRMEHFVINNIDI